MRVETGFLRSAVARRVFWVVLAAAALPLLAFAALSHGLLSDRLNAGDRSRLHEAAKYAGLRVYDRLLSAQSALAVIAAGGPIDPHLRERPLVVRQLFSAVATIEHESGLAQGPLHLVDRWRGLHADRADTAGLQRLWWSAAAQGSEGRVLLGLRDLQRWWIAELAPEFLWGDLRDTMRWCRPA